MIGNLNKNRTLAWVAGAKLGQRRLALGVSLSTKRGCPNAQAERSS